MDEVKRKHDRQIILQFLIDGSKYLTARSVKLVDDLTQSNKDITEALKARARGVDPSVTYGELIHTRQILQDELKSIQDHQDMFRTVEEIHHAELYE